MDCRCSGQGPGDARWQAVQDTSRNRWTVGIQNRGLVIRGGRQFRILPETGGYSGQGRGDAR